jgi:hypothetical protein
MQFAGSRDGGWVYTEHELEVQNENVGAYIRFPAYGGSMKLLAFSALVLSLLAVSARAGTISYGSAGAFAVLGEGGVTNTGPSLIYGDLAGSTGTYEITGFPPGAVVAPAVIFPAGAGAAIGEPFYDALAAYNTAIGLTPTTEGANNLGAGGLSTLGPGVYSFTSSVVLLNGLLQLDAGGTDTASWVFQIPTALTTGSASSVEVIDTGSAGPYTGTITWVVGSQATLGTTTAFLGTIISDATSVIETGATVGCGRVISLDAGVTLDDNIVDAVPADCAVTGAGGGPIHAPASPTPEPGTSVLLSSGLLAMVFLTFRKSRAVR